MRILLSRSLLRRWFFFANCGSKSAFLSRESQVEFRLCLFSESLESSRFGSSRSFAGHSISLPNALLFQFPRHALSLPWRASGPFPRHLLHSLRFMASLSASSLKVSLSNSKLPLHHRHRFIYSFVVAVELNSLRCLKVSQRGGGRSQPPLPKKQIETKGV